MVRAVRESDPALRRDAYETLIAAYWKPVYKYVRIKWRVDVDEARDLTQGFFARAFEKDFFEKYDPARARFRTYLRTCLDGFVANVRKADARLKRGGGSTPASLDFEAAERELINADQSADADPEEYFHREWIRGLFEHAVDRLRDQCATSGKTIHFALFSRYDLDGPDADARPSYASLASEFGVKPTDVTNYLAWTRREFRRIVLDALRAVCGGDDEFRAEARRLFGRSDP